MARWYGRAARPCAWWACRARSGTGGGIQTPCIGARTSTRWSWTPSGACCCAAPPGSREKTSTPWRSKRSTSTSASPRTPSLRADPCPGPIGTIGELLRRLMCNELHEQIRQMSQRSAEGVVDPLSTGIGRDLGRQTSQQPSQRLRPVVLQAEEVLELADYPLDDLALACGPSAIRFRPSPAGVVLRGGRHQRPVDLLPAPLPLDTRETLVGQVCVVAVVSHEGVAYGPLVGGGRSQEEGAYHALGVHHQGHLEPVDPLGLRRAAPEGGLTGEEPLARRPDSDHGRDEGGVQDPVDGRRLGEVPGEGSLDRAQLGLQGSYPAVELALGAQVREVGTQACRSEAPEVALAAEAGPLREHGQGDDLRIGEQGRTAGLLLAHGGGMVLLPPVVHEYVQ